MHPSPLTSLATLAQLAMAPSGTTSVETLVAACTLLRTALGAEEAYVVRAGDPHFVQVDAPADPTAYELKQKGYYLIWRGLAPDPQSRGALFDVVDRRISNPNGLRAGVPATHLAVLLPSDESNAELLIVRGPWPVGLSADQVDVISAARPMLAQLLSTLLDTQRRERHQGQLRSLSSVAQVLTRGLDLDAALPAIATAVAKASGFDWVSVILVNEAADHITASALNRARYSDTAIATSSLPGESANEPMLSAVLHVRQTSRPLLYRDVFAGDPGDPREPCAYDAVLAEPEMARRLERGHILSRAFFPLFAGERFFGALKFSSSTTHTFAPTEIEFLTLLSEQAALTLEGLHLHRDLRDANAALARAATHDALTGLPNRALFLDRLTQTLAHAQRTGSTVAVLFIDLDNFKAVNDRFGHALGDRLLQVVAERLRRTVRVGETAARLGGDEFTVVLDGVADEAMAAQIAERLCVAVQQPVDLGGQRLVPSASIGVACGKASSASVESLLRKADLAMYQAKARGKARAACYQESLNAVATERQALEPELGQALDAADASALLN